MDKGPNDLAHELSLVCTCWNVDCRKMSNYYPHVGRQNRCPSRACYEENEKQNHPRKLRVYRRVLVQHRSSHHYRFQELQPEVLT